MRSGRPKGKKRWVGYKVQVAETIAEDPARGRRASGSLYHLGGDSKATESDDAGLELTLEAQKAAGLESQQSYTSTERTFREVHLKSAIEQNYELVGPAQPSAGRANIPEAYRIEAFHHRHRPGARRSVREDLRIRSAVGSRRKRKSSGQVPFRVEHSLPWLRAHYPMRRV